MNIFHTYLYLYVWIYVSIVYTNIVHYPMIYVTHEYLLHIFIFIYCIIYHDTVPYINVIWYCIQFINLIILGLLRSIIVYYCIPFRVLPCIIQIFLFYVLIHYYVVVVLFNYLYYCMYLHGYFFIRAPWKNRYYNYLNGLPDEPFINK